MKTRRNRRKKVGLIKGEGNQFLNTNCLPIVYSLSKGAVEVKKHFTRTLRRVKKSSLYILERRRK